MSWGGETWGSGTSGKDKRGVGAIGAKKEPLGASKGLATGGASKSVARKGRKE